jgi:murein DD-endopeptidase MepM/ murein hydrolase activator NlpD
MERFQISVLFFTTISLGSISTYAGVSGAIMVKTAAINARSTASAKNSVNLLRGCHFKDGEILTPTDFEFSNGIPFCKIMTGNRSGCPIDRPVWIAGDKSNVTDKIPPELMSPMEPGEGGSVMSKTAAMDNCPTCEYEKKKFAEQRALLEGGITFSNPIDLEPCQGEECNCRGVSENFGNRPDPFVKGEIEFHKALDESAPRGTEVLAAADGIVTLAAFHSSYGNRVTIEHFDKTRPVEEQEDKDVHGKILGARKPQYVRVRACGIERIKKVDTLMSSYNHMSGFAPGIRPGVAVKKGQLIGYVGATGKVQNSANHLHFEIEVEGFDCQIAGAGGKCDPRLFGDLPPFKDPGDMDYKCKVRAVASNPVPRSTSSKKTPASKPASRKPARGKK